MKTYTRDQFEAILEINAISGVPLMHMDELESGEMTAEQVFDANVKWINDVAADVSAINFPSCSSDE